ncbi:hypothetical protein [Robertmurraya massiliosenegalensis]|uniref:hypothetical protein n=1 Tax=Robertmurraya massiliosenegalensis TaxID=1287657 RepID=UPI0002E5CCD3|nr:hypothetical protein [Robertmurraya massiliosenegalensis]
MDKVKPLKFLVLILFLLNLAGCSLVALDNKDDLVVQLKEKYGIDVEVTHASHNNGQYTYKVQYPEKEVVFGATTDKNGDMLSDSLIPELMSIKVEEILKAEFEKNSIDVEAHTYMMRTNSAKETNIDITLEEYLNNYQPEYLSGKMLLKEQPNVTLETIEHVYQAVYMELKETNFQAHIVIANDDETYDILAEAMNERGDINQGEMFEYEQDIRLIKAYIDQDGFHVLGNQ